MNLLTLVALLTLSLTDPSGDAIGDGSLESPTALIYANAAQFDLLGVALHSPESPRLDGEVGSHLTITMGSLSTRDNSQMSGGEVPDEDDSAADAAGTAETPTDAAETSELGSEARDEVQNDSFDLSSLLAVIDVYIGTGDGGLDRTLAGPNMLMPLGHGWRHAVRVSADGAMAITYTEPTPTDGESAQQLPGDLEFERLSVTRSGNDLVMELPWAFEDEVELYALSGVHDPFSANGWRQLSPQPSPWAFSGDSQVSPVIDLLAADAEAQSAALTSGVLPLPYREAPGFTLPRTPWLYLMIGGLLLAVVGLVMRGRVPAATKLKAVATEVEAATPPPTDTPATADSEAPVDAIASDETEVDSDAEDHVTLADEPPPVDEVLLAENDRTASSDGAEDAVILEVSDQESNEVTLVRYDAGQPDQASPDHDLSTASEEPPPTVELGFPRSRALVDSKVEMSFLGADTSGFEDDEANRDELDESFWHPRSRKPTLTEVNSGGMNTNKVSGNKVSGNNVSGSKAGISESGINESATSHRVVRNEDAADQD